MLLDNKHKRLKILLNKLTTKQHTCQVNKNICKKKSPEYFFLKLIFYFVLWTKAVPYFAVKPSSTAVERGRNMRLDCLAVGIPLSTLSWKLNGVPVSSANVMANGSLLVTSVQNTKNNEGLYVCEIGKSSNGIKASAMIVVYGRWTCEYIFKTL